MTQQLRIVFFTAAFGMHRCTPNPIEREAKWIDGTARAIRVYPQVEAVIPEDTPADARVFYCPDCNLVGITPGKKP